MSAHTFSSRHFTREVSAAKRATADGPVFITDRGRPAYALLKIEDYYRMLRKNKPRSTLLSVMDEIPGGGLDIEFEPARLDIRVKKIEFE